MSEVGDERERAAARRRRRRRGGSGAARGAQGASATPGGAAAPARRPSASAGTRAGAPGREAPDGGRGGPRPAGSRATGSRAAASRAPASRAPASRAAGTRTTAARGAPAPGGRSAAASVAETRLAAHELADAQNEEHRRANARRRRALGLSAAAVPAVVLGVVLGAAVGIVVGAVVAVVVFAAVLSFVREGALAVALRMVGGSPVPDQSLPVLANQVEGLCATLGVAQPALRLVDDPVANACALAARGRSVLVVTSGLLSRLGLIEMEGVVAHELVHLKRRDADVSTVAIATAGIVAWATGRDGLVHAAVGRGREFGADQAAALAVRYPPGLHDALISLGARPAGPGSSFAGRRWAATRWIWIDPMVGAPAEAAGELDATAVRIDALAEW
ncbi:MAG TPA: M48 family metalloprotease [Acidimicrobiales bacterium]|nr:M48 family metalloprotease [Acidimicrobiales bacterium]